tara:strand:- start:13994 stop:14596 length:603 start_codon:yes stop_codon:yes gene_type:complete
MLWEYKISNQIKEYELRHDPVIITVNEFTEESSKAFRSKVALAHNTGQKVIPVIIDSFGGEVVALMSMISTIEQSKLPVATIVEGKAMSCGAALLAFGTEGYRFVDQHATVMIHDISGGVIGKVDDMIAKAENARRLNDKIYKMMARQCGKNDTYFLDELDKKKHADWYLEADECIEIGLAQFKRVPSMSVSVDVDIKFI